MRTERRTRFWLVAENVPPAWAAAAPIKRSAFPASGVKHHRKESAMFRFLRKFVGNSSSRSKPAGRAQLEVECLESRELMTAGITLAAGVLKVEASGYGDTVKFDRLDNGTPNNPYDDKIKVTWTHNGQTDTQTF